MLELEDQPPQKVIPQSVHGSDYSAFYLQCNGITPAPSTVSHSLMFALAAWLDHDGLKLFCALCALANRGVLVWHLAAIHCYYAA
jgi:hypothetical protein